MSTKETSTPKLDDRARLWTIVVYPTEGNPPAPANWREILDDIHVEWIESPVHDRDTNPDGTPKRPHIHVMLLFEGKKSFEQIKEISDALNAPRPEKVASGRGMVRYMAHLDNPDKQAYSVSEIIGHGGADPSEFLRATASTRYQLIREMQSWCVENRCVEIADLLLYASEVRFDDWFPLLCDNSLLVMSAFVKSLKYKISQ